MKLTAFTDYGLRVLIFLAADLGRRATVAEIASAFGVSHNHLTKVVNLLARKGWVSAVRGNGGGLMLARAPSDIVVGQVVRDMEGGAKPAECFDTSGTRCAIATLCRLRGVLRQAVEAFDAVLDSTTLADVMDPQVITQLVKRPRPARPAS